MRGLLLALLLGSAAHAQTLTGTVRDATTGETLPGALVSIVGTPLGAATGVDGHFAIRDVPPGRHAVRVTFVGFLPLDLLITVRGATRFEAVLRVDPDAPTFVLGCSYGILSPMDRSPYASRVWARDEILRLPTH